MKYFEIGFYICNTPGFLRIMYLAKICLNLIRFAIPIILILMIMIDLYKNVINPKEKEGMKKITNRIVAAVIIFFVPTLVGVVINLIDFIMESDTESYKLSNCYTNANMACIENIEKYLNCKNIEDSSERSKCINYRNCHDYQVGDNCSIKTVIGKGCDDTYDYAIGTGTYGS